MERKTDAYILLVLFLTLNATKYRDREKEARVNMYNTSIHPSILCGPQCGGGLLLVVMVVVEKEKINK